MRTVSQGLVFALFAASWSVPVPAGELEVKDFKSSAIDQEVKINVLLPDGYKDDVNRRYPVVYLLHGYGGDYREWEKVGVVEEAAKLSLIIVMPEGDKSFYVNHHEAPKARWEDYITKEVVELIDKTYRTVAARHGRGISGLSMGGYGAMALGLRHPELFASVASHSGALGVPGDVAAGEIDERLKVIFGPKDASTRESCDLFRLSKELAPEKRPHIYIDCGSSDFLLESNRKLVAHLATQKIDYEYREVPGAHNFAYWKANVRYSLTQQLKALEAAAKKSGSSGAGGLAGTWGLTLKFQEQDYDYDLRFTDEGGALKAVLISPRSGEHPVKSVSFKDGAFKMEIERDIQGNNITFAY